MRESSVAHTKRALNIESEEPVVKSAHLGNRVADRSLSLREREREAQELQELEAWATEYWGNEEVVEIVDDGGEADAMGRPELGQPLPQPGAEPRRPELQPPLPPQTEGRVRVRGPNNSEANEPRRRFTSPSSLDQDD